jgi:hypothetical protein
MIKSQLPSQDTLNNNNNINEENFDSEMKALLNKHGHYLNYTRSALIQSNNNNNNKNHHQPVLSADLLLVNSLLNTNNNHVSGNLDRERGGNSAGDNKPLDIELDENNNNKSSTDQNLLANSAVGGVTMSDNVTEII